jgi:hypothetical protein
MREKGTTQDLLQQTCLTLGRRHRELRDLVFNVSEPPLPFPTPRANRQVLREFGRRPAQVCCTK